MVPANTGRKVAIVLGRSIRCCFKGGNESRPGVAVVHQGDQRGCGKITGAHRGGLEVGGKSLADGFDHGVREGVQIRTHRNILGDKWMEDGDRLGNRASSMDWGWNEEIASTCFKNRKTQVSQ